MVTFRRGSHPASIRKRCRINRFRSAAQGPFGADAAVQMLQPSSRLPATTYVLNRAYSAACTFGSTHNVAAGRRSRPMIATPMDATGRLRQSDSPPPTHRTLPNPVPPNRRRRTLPAESSACEPFAPPTAAERSSRSFRKWNTNDVKRQQRRVDGRPQSTVPYADRPRSRHDRSVILQPRCGVPNTRRRRVAVKLNNFRLCRPPFSHSRPTAPVRDASRLGAYPAGRQF